MLELYENIKKRRLELGLTQQELAELTGYTSGKSMIAKIETGKVDLTQTKILLFAKVLRTTPGELMGLSGCTEYSNEKSEVEMVIEDDLSVMKEDQLQRVLKYVELIKRGEL